MRVKLYDALTEKLGIFDPRVVIVGEYTPGAYQICLRPWSQSKVEDLAKQSPFQFGQNAVNSIFEKPVLSILATEARSAGLLLTALKDTYPADAGDRRTWLDDSEAMLAMTVIENYVSSIGLQHLNAEARRRVAALVIHTGENAKRCKLGMPEFEGLPNETEKNVAISLISRTCTNDPSTNEEWYYVKRGLCYCQQKRAVNITPVMDIVLMSVLYGPSQAVTSYVNTTWTGLRAHVIKAVDDYLKHFVTNPDMAGEELNRRLKSLNAESSP
jgi:hypothetical protein